MRASTFFFLALFAAMVWTGHLRHGAALGLHRSCCDEPARVATPDPREPDPAASPRAAAIASEILGLEQRGRLVDRSLQSIAQSERALRDLVRRRSDPAVERELHEIETGERRLRDLKQEVETRRVVLQARLQLVRAGLDVDDDAEPPRPVGPVDALSSAVVPLRNY
jgi:hypothetical protein